MKSVNELTQRSNQNNGSVVRKAVVFIKQQKQKTTPKKYSPNQEKQFIKAYEELDYSEQYTCAQVFLSNAWSHINSNKKLKARQDLSFILPLMQEKQQFQFADFEIDKMLWESWVNDNSLSEAQKEQNTTLLKQCGFVFHDYQKPVVRKQRSGFKRFLDKFKCLCFKDK